MKFGDNMSNYCTQINIVKESDHAFLRPCKMQNKRIPSVNLKLELKYLLLYLNQLCLNVLSI